MSLLGFHHGIRFASVGSARQALRVVATSVIGLVAMASDADAGTFPLNTPVAVTDLKSAIADAGELGTLRASLKAIDGLVNTIVVVVRVPKSVLVDAEDAAAADVAATIAGLGQLTRAEQVTGVKPRIIGAPGLDTPAVVAELASTCVELSGFGYFDCGSDGTVAEAIAYRGGFGARELMPIYGNFSAADADGAIVEVPGVAYALGLRAQIDQTQGFFKTLSNVPIDGVTGLTAPVTWDLLNPSTEAGTLNAADVTCTVRRSGFRFWGNRTCSEDPRFVFESATRTDQVIRDTIADGVFPYIDRPLTPGLARDIVEDVAALGRELVRAGALAGFRAFLTDANTPSTLAAGKLRIGYAYSATPPLEDLGFEVEVTDEFFADFAQLAA